MKYPNVLLALLLFASPGVVMAQEGPDRPTDWTVKKALKQMDRATAEAGGITAEIEYEELYRSRTVSGSGTIQVRFDGRVRADIGGSSPRTFLVSQGYLHLYNPVDEAVEVFLMAANPDMLAQYALIGFQPAGSQLKKQYELTVIEETTLPDGRNALLLDLKPKSKQVAGIVTKIRLWVDTDNWMPAAQLVFHKPSGIQVSVRYSGVSLGADLPNETFRANWPEGTKTIRR